MAGVESSSPQIAKKLCGRSKATDHSHPTAFFNMKIGCHGLGVLDKAVPIEHSHGLTEDGKTVAPRLEADDGPATTRQG